MPRYVVSIYLHPLLSGVKKKTLLQKRTLLERTLRKRLHASVDTVKTLRNAAERTRVARVKAATERRAKQDARLALNGLTGQKFGKHVVREGEVDVQLGEELSESLRGLQVCVYSTCYLIVFM